MNALNFSNKKWKKDEVIAAWHDEFMALIRDEVILIADIFYDKANCFTVWNVLDALSPVKLHEDLVEKILEEDGWERFYSEEDCMYYYITHNTTKERQ